MKTIKIKQEYLFSFLKILIIILILNFLSYKYFLSNFIDIEKVNNKNNIHTLLAIMDENLKSLENSVIDYAHWDDTYDYIKNKNKEYIYDNFREGSNTVETLNLHFMIFTDINNNKIYSNFSKKSEENLEIENDITKNFSENEMFSTLYIPKSFINKRSSNFFFITKIPITNNDETKTPNGFIYAGKLISNEILHKLTNVYERININHTQHNSSIVINSKSLKNIKLETTVNDNYLENLFELYNHQNKYILSILTRTKRDLVIKGKETILIYNITITIFLFIIFFQLFKNKLFLESYNKRLKVEVDNKTNHLEQANEKLRFLSQTDELTKVNNRRNFFKLGEEALEKSIKENTDFHLVMLDIDNFKKINDTYGHDIGDKVLINVSSKIKDILKDDEIFARIGGEEFSIIFTNSDIEKAYVITEIIRKEIENSKISINKDNEVISCTISFGLVSRNDNNTLDSILKNADTLLYEAKDRGKNCIIRQRS